MCFMLINNKQRILILCDPVSIKELSDDPVASNMVDPGLIDLENPFATFA